MILTLHGTGAGTPGGDRSASALTASFSNGEVVLFDAGEGCSRGMLRDGIDLLRVTRVAISHMHPDHWTGLPNLIMAWAVAKRSERVEILVPTNSLDFFEQVLVHCYLFRGRLPCELHNHPLAHFELPDGWRVETFPTTHLASVADVAGQHHRDTIAFGYLLLNGPRKIVLSQDIGGAEDLREEIHGAELLVCESAHVDPLAVLEMAADAHVERVIFTHVPPVPPPFPERFDSLPWEVAREGVRVTL